jgi:hypothetical protein
MRSFTKYYYGHKIKLGVWGGSFSMHGRCERCYKTLVGKPEGKRPLGRPSIDGRIILEWILEK